MKKYTLLVVIVFATMLFHSCEDDTQIVVKDALKNPNINPGGQVVYFDANPYEQIGIDHNIVMDEIYDLLYECFKNGNYDNCLLNSDSSLVMDMVFSDAFSIDFRQALINTGFISTTVTIQEIRSEFRTSITEIWDESMQLTALYDEMIEVLDSSSTQQDKEYTLAIYNALLKSINNNTIYSLRKIAINLKLGSLEQIMYSLPWHLDEHFAFKCLAITRHSTNLFTENGTQGKISLIYLGKKKKSSKYWKAAAITADAAGAVVGAVGGAIATAPIGGLGALWGAFVGGAKASAAVLTAKMAYDLANEE